MIPASFATIISFVGAHKFATLLILFASMVLEGESFLIVSGVLVQIGALPLWEVFSVSLVGVLLGDILWYSLGVLIRRTKIAQRPIAVMESVVSHLLPQFREKPFLSLVLAKYIYGTNHATLILSGVIGMNFWLFAKAEFVASAIWIIVFVTVGYIFGEVALLVSHQVSVFLLIVLILILTVIGLQKGVAVYLENRRKPKN